MSGSPAALPGPPAHLISCYHSAPTAHNRKTFHVNPVEEHEANRNHRHVHILPFSTNLFEFVQFGDLCDAGQAHVDEAEQFQI